MVSLANKNDRVAITHPPRTLLMILEHVRVIGIFVPDKNQ